MTTMGGAGRCALPMAALTLLRGGPWQFFDNSL
jgi:hypothetical protein